MNIACLDLEGVLVPEIWINVSKATSIKELSLTTRDISDYDKLMQHRIKILKENNITLKEIKDVISKMQPLPGALEFYYKLRESFQVIILSDTYYEFAMPLMKQFGYPVIFCHNLVVDEKNFIVDYKLRLKNSKKEAVLKLKDLNFFVVAAGDSYNDIEMLKSADKGIFFRPPENIKKEFPEFLVAETYDDLLKEFMLFK